MAIFNFYKAVNMLYPSIWYGFVFQATPTNIIIADSIGDAAIYTGSFTYNSTQVTGGTVNTFTEYTHGTLSFTVSNLNLDALTVYNLVQSANAAAVEQYALSGGGNTITGSIFSDYLIGFGGTNTFVGSDGSDTINGGSGLNEVIYAGSQSSYSISAGANGIESILKPSSSTDTLSNIGFLHFDNTSAVIAAPNSINEEVSLLYRGALGRTPDFGGLAYWDNVVSNLPSSAKALGVFSLSDTSGDHNGNGSIAAGFTQSAEFIQNYGNLTNNDFVTLLYANILDRAPDAGGLAFWLSNLTDGVSREHLLVGFAESAEAISNATLGFVGQSGHHEPWLFLTH